MFERLQTLLQQMQSTIKEEAVVLKSDDLPIVPMGVEDPVQKFTVLVSQPFKVLVWAIPLESDELGFEADNSRLYQVELTFEADAIASFLTQLTQHLENHPIILHLLNIVQTSVQPNDGAIQTEFTFSLMEILTTDTPSSTSVNSNPLHRCVSVCQPIQQALQQQIEQERLLNQVTTQIRQSLELPIILATAVEQVRHFLQVDRLAIYQFDFNYPIPLTQSNTSLTEVQTIKTGKNKTKGQTNKGNNKKIKNLPTSEQLDWGCVTYEARSSHQILSVLNLIEEQNCSTHVPNCREKYHQGLTVAVEDVEVTYAGSSCLLELLRRTQIRAKLVAPIIVQNTLWGLLIAHECFKPRRWHDKEKVFLKQIAEHLAVAIYQAQLYAQLQHQKTTLEERVIERTQELRDALQATQAANRAKGEFLATMSHELRTPLTCVIGLSATLLRWSFNEGGTPIIPLDKQRQYLKMIQENGEHLLDLINDILDLSQVEAGKAVLNITEFSLAKLSHQTLRSLQEKATLRNIELEMDFRIKPQQDRFRADQRRVKQILFNLLGNAIKFTPEDGKVTLRVWREQNLAIFQIEDTGIGIADEHLPLLFQKFQQLETTYHRRYEGTGLGLALTKQLVELHGGTIDVESSVGEGSIFTVGLPLQSLIPDVSTKSEIPQGENPQPQGSIVLVDNHEATATAICEILTAAGYHVVWLIDGSAALQQIELLEPDAVIVDWHLPTMDGYEISHSLHNSPTTAQIKVLALTTPDLSPSEKQDLSAIVDDYLSKPIEPVQLLHKVTALMAL